MAAYPSPVPRLALRMKTEPQPPAPQRSTDMADPAASIDAGSTQDVPKEDRTWRGKFITLEGGEGTGKSTQAAILAQHLQSLGLPVLLTREPGGSPGAEIIRHVLLSGAAEPFGPETEAMLFAAARGDHIRCAIEPALAAGRWVVCDRFADSTRVYQGVLGQVDQRFLNALERVSIGNLSPDLTLILDTPVKVGLERAAARRASAEPDRFESQDLKFHEKLREAFLTLALDSPERCVIIRANAAKDDVAKRVWQAVDSKLKPAPARAAVKNAAS
jgi:dTMP kinase